MLWHDGQVITDTAVSFDLRDRGLLLADGLFETLLVLGGTPHQLNAHLSRMSEAAKVLRLPLDVDVPRRAVLDLAASLDGPGVVRVTVTRGAGARGLAIPVPSVPRVFATAAPWSPAVAFTRQRLATATIRRNETSPLSRIKSLNYLDNVLAFDEAVAAGGDDALMLSRGGLVACTSMANVFMIRGAHLVTPPPRDGVRAGTMRALVLRLAAQCGLQPEERSFAASELMEADAVFSTNSVRLMTTVIALDGHALGPDCKALDSLVAALRLEIHHECGPVDV